MTRDHLLLGVDGGGSKTVACLASKTISEEINVIGRGRAGPSNIYRVGSSAATDNLGRAVTAAFADANVERARVSRACLALAGVGDESRRETIEAWASGWDLAERLEVVHDALPILKCGTPDGWGIALICGTGSLAFGADSDGDTMRCGGWGPLVGDEGSGDWIAASGLRAITRALDGRGPDTKLLDLISNHLELAPRGEQVGVFRELLQDRSKLAGLTPLVFEAAAKTDAQATKIVELATIALAEMIVSLAGRLNLPAPFPLALSGGVIVAQTSFREQVCAEATRRGVQLDPVQVVEYPERAALQWAAEMD